MDGQNNYRWGRPVVSAMPAHLVFVRRYRSGVFDDEMPTRCEEIMRKVCEDFEAELKEFNGERDHVHLLVHCPLEVAVSKLVNSLKGVSTRRIRQEFTGPTTSAIMYGPLWSPSYFSASCGGAPLAIVRQYIEEQQRPL
ncbi:IS200/IS605 family transposase [Streptomyces olivaceus]|uniref:IS200/IS605 family transposase n=1 Tax=Streptomyces TaxID=1883 RepID=UPI001CCA8F78|nr:MULTISPECIES: IS200/IS605 family transposase [Streptomyces]MBZ6138027.1 IS200/IS605 family transposase [Streptomyces olivaceus]MBZ6164876.1 IS200/IS605 family transposase [Streptomyces olivaceus]MBZ6173578.1 IS200/IS605 family transposase [Streptomyces olivaceus]MBZ6179507.1 IS200/IS605 family transposase [Streptomyces olivaceus]MBZ6255674.1 IS200/IS605 family transposase [Streptomyces olivaceus]